MKISRSFTKAWQKLPDDLVTAKKRRRKAQRRRENHLFPDITGIFK